MRVLAVETSCDDTSLALVRFDGKVFELESMFSYTQTIHQKYGGVVPEIASREHAIHILLVLEKLVEDWKEKKKLTEKTFFDTCEQKDLYDLFFSDIAMICYTVEPGLPGSLLVGKVFAETLATWYNKPLVPTHHIFGHICSLFLERNIDEIAFPLAVLTASGGHNEIYIVEKVQKPKKKKKQSTCCKTLTSNEVSFSFSFHKIGTTRDDAAGECFDKVARMLGGPYPGGAWISQQADAWKNACEKNRSQKNLSCCDECNGEFSISFPRIFLEHDSFDFSFSGMKAFVHRFLSTLKNKNLSSDDIAYISYEFQEAMVEVLAKKLIRAGLTYNVATLALVGGVSCNDRLREYLHELTSHPTWLKNQLSIIRKGKKQKNENTNSQFSSLPSFSLLRPVKKIYSTDNGAMIGVAGILQYLGVGRF